MFVFGVAVLSDPAAKEPRLDNARCRFGVPPSSLCGGIRCPSDTII